MIRRRADSVPNRRFGMGFRRARFWSIRNTNATATAWSLSTISPRAHAFRYHSCITLGFIVGVKPCGDLLGIGFVRPSGLGVRRRCAVCRDTSLRRGGLLMIFVVGPARATAIVYVLAPDHGVVNVDHTSGLAAA